MLNIFNKIKYPYNINILTQKQALATLENADQTQEWVNILLNERTKLANQLKKLAIVEYIYPSDANFLLVKVADANDIYQDLVQKGIIVRNRSNVTLCFDCLRITVGTPEENKILINELKKY
jgi:histidinol-phosphate aminotransferase